jgi:hypothetical protein
MPISDEWEHLQNVLRQVHNRVVREEFSDIDPDDDISTPRGSLKAACLLKDSDSALMTILRYWLFYVDLKKAQDLAPAIYGIPVTTFQEKFQFAPHIKLFFLEDSDDVEDGYRPVAGEISFKLVGETHETITPTKAQQLANKVRTAFASGSGFIWQKGRITASYLDKARGYDFRLLVINETEARKVIEQVLDIQNHSPDWENLTITESRANFPITPPSRHIYGRSRRLPRKRPRANVRFRVAELHIWGVANPIILVDRSGMYRNALETA